MCSPIQKATRCAYGVDRGTRCTNTRADSASAGLTFQSVPNNPAVLSHMAIKTWKGSYVCCSSHGQDKNFKLSTSNLPTRASPQTTKRGRDTNGTSFATPIKKQDRKGATAAVSTERLERRLLDALDMEARREETELRAANKRKDTLIADSGGDPLIAIDKLMEETNDLKKRLKDTKAKANDQELAINDLSKRLREFRPESWGDVTDEWVRVWTLFRQKAGA